MTGATLVGQAEAEDQVVGATVLTGTQVLLGAVQLLDSEAKTGQMVVVCAMVWVV
jgi:hypothetical protein